MLPEAGLAAYAIGFFGLNSSSPASRAGGFVANLTISNTGTSAINGWTLGFTFPGDQKVTNSWNGTAAQSGETVTASNASYDATISPGGSSTLGLQGTWASSDAAPASFTLNGTPCT